MVFLERPSHLAGSGTCFLLVAKSPVLCFLYSGPAPMLSQAVCLCEAGLLGGDRNPLRQAHPDFRQGVGIACCGNQGGFSFWSSISFSFLSLSLSRPLSPLVFPSCNGSVPLEWQSLLCFSHPLNASLFFLFSVGNKCLCKIACLFCGIGSLPSSRLEP